MATLQLANPCQEQKWLFPIAIAGERLVAQRHVDVRADDFQPQALRAAAHSGNVIDPAAIGRAGSAVTKARRDVARALVR